VPACEVARVHLFQVGMDTGGERWFATSDDGGNQEFSRHGAAR
jgi:hypothetical protein